MRSSRATFHPASSAGFSLVELLVGLSLALLICTAVLSSYLFLARNLTRLANQQTVETEARRTLGYFAQDASSATSLTNPSATSVTFTIPISTGDTLVEYKYHTAATNIDGVAIPAFSITRTRTFPTPADKPRVLARDLVPLSFKLSYFDAFDREYTDPSSTAYRIGIKKLSLTYVARTGSGINGTLTPNYTATSPRLALRNRAFLE